MLDTDLTHTPIRRAGRLLGAVLMATAVGLLAGACDDDVFRDANPQPDSDRGAAQAAPVQPVAEPPDAAPGASPSAARATGTWIILSAPGSRTQGDKAEGTTYRFEELGKVTVAGAKQCAYRIEAANLTIDCDGAPMTGAISFPDAETMIWTVSGKERITLKKR